MASKIYKVKPREDHTVDVTFFNGIVKRCDVEGLAQIYPEYHSVISGKHLFATAKVDRSKDHILWENGVKLGNESVWFNGVEIDVVTIDDAAIAFAERLRIMRESLFMTQKDLEERSGVYQADISKIERGEANPSLATMKKLTDSMNMSLEFFGERKQRIKECEVPLNEVVARCHPDKFQGEFKVNDLMDLPEPVCLELMEGVVYDLASPAPTILHQRIVGKLFYEFTDYINKHGGKCEALISPVSVQFENDDRTLLLPDLLVVCDTTKVRRDGVMGAPDFVLEVISKATGKRDYAYKTAIYAKQGVREYWILDPMKKCLITYFFENDYMPTMHFGNEKVPVMIYEGELEIDLSVISEQPE